MTMISLLTALPSFSAIILFAHGFAKLENLQDKETGVGQFSGFIFIVTHPGRPLSLFELWWTSWPPLRGRGPEEIQTQALIIPSLPRLRRRLRRGEEGGPTCPPQADLSGEAL
jgi:hypothetical protein